MGLEMVAVALAAPPLLNREEESERGNGLSLFLWLVPLKLWNSGNKNVIF